MTTIGQSVSSALVCSLCLHDISKASTPSWYNITSHKTKRFIRHYWTNNKVFGYLVQLVFYFTYSPCVHNTGGKWDVLYLPGTWYWQVRCVAADGPLSTISLYTFLLSTCSDQMWIRDRTHSWLYNFRHVPEMATNDIATKGRKCEGVLRFAFEQVDMVSQIRLCRFLNVFWHFIPRTTEIWLKISFDVLMIDKLYRITNLKKPLKKWTFH
jgi:hypothetical protein